MITPATHSFRVGSRARCYRCGADLDDTLLLDVGAVALALQGEWGHQSLDLGALAVRLAILALLGLHAISNTASQQQCTKPCILRALTTYWE